MRRAIGVVLLLAGCGSAASSAPAPTTPASSSPAAAPTPPPTTTPDHARPFVPEVVERMTLVRPAVLACLAGVGGAVSFAIEVAGDGRVVSVSARAPEENATVPEVDIRGTQQEGCAVEALSRVRFTPFTDERFAFSFPFSER